MKQIIHWGESFGALNATLFQSLHGMYPPINGATLEPARGTPWSVAGTLRNLKVNHAVAPGAGRARIVTLMKNGTATALTCTVTHPATSASDVVNTVSVVAGDTVSLRYTNTGGAPVSSFANALNLEFDATDDNESGYCKYSPLTFLNTSSIYEGLCFAAVGTTSSFDWLTNPGYRSNELMPLAGTITRIDFAYRASGLGNGNADMAVGHSVQFTIVKNGIVQDGSNGTTNTSTTFAYPATTATWTGALAVSAGDTLKWRITPSAQMVNDGNLTYPIMWSWCFDATTAHRFWIGSNGLTASTSVPFYGTIAGTHPGVDATESNQLGAGSVSTWYLLNMQHVSDGGSSIFAASPRLNSTSPAGIPSTTFGTSLFGGGPGTLQFGVWAVGSAVSPGGSFMTITSADTWNLMFELSEAIQGSAVFGVTTTVTATRAVAFGLDGAVNVHSTIGTLKIFGNLEVTGTTTSGGDLNAELDGLGT